MASSAKKVITGKVRASYVNVFRPRLNDLNGEEEYSMQLIIPKADTATVGKIKDAIKEAANDKWAGKPPKGLRNPLRDADAEAQAADEPVAPHLKGCYFMNVKNKQRPGLVDKDKLEVLDAQEFQSGDYCRASINAYAYDTKGNRGVAFGLNNVQVLAKGDPLGNRTRAEDDFDEWEDDEDSESWED